jgi:hypothetical protein
MTAALAQSAPAKERPILFSGEMVRAILEGRKTQTRRVASIADNVRICEGTAKGFLPGLPDGFVIPCPYGQTGDRLWVREAWCPATWGSYEPRKEIPRRPSDALIQFRADYRSRSSVDYDGHWKPSIFLPRWASRLTLEITKIRVERVQEISHEDALAEGCKGYEWVESSPYIAGPHTDAGQLPAEEYKELWDSINGKRGFGWDKNPWVWVIEFRRIA